MTDSRDENRLKRAATLYGFKKEVNPFVTLLDEVKWRAGHVEQIRMRMGELSEDELFYVDVVSGRMIDAPIVKRYDKERDLLDRVCKLAIDAGISERYINLAELQGQVLMTTLNEAFDDPTVALTDGQRQALGVALQRAFKKAQGNLDDDAILDAESQEPSPLQLGR